VITVRRVFWGVLIIFVSGSLGVFFLPVLAPNFPPESIAIPYRLMYVSLLLIVISWVWAFFSIRGLRLKRIGRGFRQQLGDVFEEHFEISNAIPLFRLWLEVRDKSNLPGSSGSRVFSWIGAREVRTYSSYTLLTQRGEFDLGPTELYSGDPFGLFAFHKTLLTDNSVLVLPYFVKLTSFPYPPGVLSGGRIQQLKTPEVTPHAAGVREYAPGDPLSRIHWPSTARRDRFMVKEFDQDPQADVWILLDAQKSVHYSQPDDVVIPPADRFWLWKNRYQFTLPTDTFEYSVSVAASVANYFLRQGLAVGMISSGQITMAMAAERGERQLTKILENLAFMKSEGTLPLLGLVEAQLSHLPRGSIVVMITPSGHDTIALAADALHQRRMKPVVVLIDGASFGGDNSVAYVSNVLRQRRIPASVVKKGMDLRLALERGFMEEFQKPAN
jgi:uncharacterized protein (DUF58 family)